MAYSRYEYLANPVILDYISRLKQRTQWTRLTILNRQDLPLKAIEGRATGGSITINSSSSVRRTGSITLVTDYDQQARASMSDLDIMNEVTNTKTLISMNKRVQVEIGIKNTGGEYIDFDIFWIPLGTFVISNASVTYNEQGITISLKLNDKMVLLNGEEGGTFSNPIQHSPIDDGGTLKQVKYRDLIKTLVIDAGEIPEWQIIIDDIPDQTQSPIYWNPQQKVINQASNKFEYPWLFFKKSDDNDIFSIVEPETELVQGEIRYYPYDIIGVLDGDFVYPTELTSNAGESIASVLEKIKNNLGNYEYFFDTDGVFHFQQIKNYLNEGSSKEGLVEALAEKYFLKTRKDKIVYSFEDAVLIKSYTNNPQYQSIKNDYSVWGTTNQGATNIHYHLLLDNFDNSLKKYFIKEINLPNGLKLQDIDLDLSSGTAIVISDWRANSYLEAKQKEYSKRSFLEREIVEFLPKTFQLFKKPDSNEYELKQQENIDIQYYLDGIDINDPSLPQGINIKDFGISDIGRRTKVISDNDINCIFSQDIPEAIFKKEQKPIDSQNKVIYEEDIQKEGYLKTENEEDLLFFNNISYSIENPAYDALRMVLHESLSYNNNINLSTMPVYHLDVNQRIYVKNEEADIDGDYIIKSITIPLALNGMMTINAQQAVERI